MQRLLEKFRDTGEVKNWRALTRILDCAKSKKKNVFELVGFNNYRRGCKRHGFGLGSGHVLIKTISNKFNF